MTVMLKIQVHKGGGHSLAVLIELFHMSIKKLLGFQLSSLSATWLMRFSITTDLSVPQCLELEDYVYGVVFLYCLILDVRDLWHFDVQTLFITLKCLSL